MKSDWSGRFLVGRVGKLMSCPVTTDRSIGACETCRGLTLYTFHQKKRQRGCHTENTDTRSSYGGQGNVSTATSAREMLQTWKAAPIGLCGEGGSTWRSWTILEGLGNHVWMIIVLEFIQSQVRSGVEIVESSIPLDTHSDGNTCLTRRMSIVSTGKV